MGWLESAVFSFSCAWILSMLNSVEENTGGCNPGDLLYTVKHWKDSCTREREYPGYENQENTFSYGVKVQSRKKSGPSVCSTGVCSLENICSQRFLLFFRLASGSPCALYLYFIFIFYIYILYLYFIFIFIFIFYIYIIYLYFIFIFYIWSLYL